MKPLLASLSIGVVVVLLCVALVGVGRWERRHAAAKANETMSSLLATVGPLKTTIPLGFRYDSPNCLAYPVGTNPFALQLCWDRNGRLVETVDRRYGAPRYTSLTWDDALATNVIAPSVLAGIFRHATTPPHVRHRR